MIEEKEPKTREEIFTSSSFEWVKTDREGDVCNFQGFEIENGVEYVNFTDGSRIKSEFIGDIVLMHVDQSEILGKQLLTIVPQGIQLEQSSGQVTIGIPSSDYVVSVNPVVAILDKSKKKVEKLNLSITVRIPSVELYSVIKENFEDTDDVLLENVMNQIHDNTLREAVKKELQALYSKKKKI
jgi:hypothetical protein